MYPQLLGMKAARKLSDEDLARVVGVTRQTLANKLQNGNFTVTECKILCKEFDKPFNYLFATEEEIG